MSKCRNRKPWMESLRIGCSRDSKCLSWGKKNLLLFFERKCTIQKSCRHFAERLFPTIPTKVLLPLPTLPRSTQPLCGACGNGNHNFGGGGPVPALEGVRCGKLGWGVVFQPGTRLGGQRKESPMSWLLQREKSLPVALLALLAR